LFKPELDAWQAARPEFTVNYVKRLTAAPHSIDPHSLIYVSGPSAMVDDLGGTLLAQGVPQSQLLRDWFTGKMPTEG
jgi:ferredoxin-NADP reductase